MIAMNAICPVIFLAVAALAQGGQLRATHHPLQSHAVALGSVGSTTNTTQNTSMHPYYKAGRHAPMRKATGVMYDGKIKEVTQKIVVNSNAHYDIARKMLFASLVDSGFTDFSNVIVVLGGSRSNSEPYIPKDELGARGVIYIDVKLDSFDYHGFSAMYHHIEHPWVKAQQYLYLLDTSLVNKTFPRTWERLKSFSVGDKEVRHAPAPFSNICLIGNGVVHAWGTNFDHAVNKRDGLQLEAGTGVPVKLPDGKEVRVQPLLHFAEVNSHFGRRVDTHVNVDLYHTGHPRHGYYYPELSLTKYILHNKFGDLAPGPVKYTYGAMASFVESNLSAIDQELGI